MDDTKVAIIFGSNENKLTTGSKLNWVKIS